MPLLAGISNNCGQLTDDRTSPLNVHLFSFSLPNNCNSKSSRNSDATAIAAATSTACVRIVNCSTGRARQTNPQTNKLQAKLILFISISICVFFPHNQMCICQPFDRCTYDIYLCTATTADVRRQFYKKIEQPYSSGALELCDPLALGQAKVLAINERLWPQTCMSLWYFFKFFFYFFCLTSSRMPGSRCLENSAQKQLTRMLN